jgi:hypothetical protein
MRLRFPLIFLLASSACGGSDSTTSPPATTPSGGGSTNPAAVASVTLDASSVSLGVGATRQFTVTLRSPAGAELTGRTVEWSTSSAAVATVSSSGFVTAVNVGAATITATSEGRTATAQVSVTPGVLATLVATGDSAVLGTWGDTARLVVQGRDRAGNSVNVPTLSFTSSDTTIATVSSSGALTSRRAGVATITFRADSVQGTARAVVRLQLNTRCTVPGAAVARGPARGTVSFAEESGSRFAPNLMPYSMKNVVVLDVDRDGRSDLLIFDSNVSAPAPAVGRAKMFRNTGSAFADVTTSVLGATPIEVVYPQFNEVADFNGDGLVDIFVGVSGYDSSPFPGGRNLLFLGGAGGTLREVSATALPTNPVSFTHGASSGDIDCDGDVDLMENLIRTPSVEQGFRVQVNAGNATFTERASLLLPMVGPILQSNGNSGWLAIKLCDFDRDGDPDLYLGGRYSSLPGEPRFDMLLANDGFGRFRARPTAALPPPLFGSRTDVIDAQCADFDGDGWNDLAMAASESSATFNNLGGRVAFWRNNRDMTFTDVTSASSPRWPGATYPVQTMIADFNNDGWPDVLGTGYGAPWNGFWTSGIGGNAIFFNDGRGGFTRQALDNWFGNLVPIDVNADGKLDLFWAGAQQRPDQPATALPRVYIQR